MEKYQEDYENNQMVPMPLQTHTVHHISTVDILQDTIDLEITSLFEGSHLSDS